MGYCEFDLQILLDYYVRLDDRTSDKFVTLNTSVLT